MGLLELIAAPVSAQFAERGTAVVIGGAIFGFIVLSVVLNVLNQVLFANPNEPPVVFHWFPIIGSTVTYGIDPYKFFFNCKEKVCLPPRSRVGKC